MEAKTAVMEVIEASAAQRTPCPRQGEIFFCDDDCDTCRHQFLSAPTKFVRSDGGALECFEARERGPSPSTRMLGHRGGTATDGGGHRRTSSSGSIGSSRGNGELSELGAEIKDIDLARENGTGKQFVNYVLAVRRKEAR